MKVRHFMIFITKSILLIYLTINIKPLFKVHLEKYIHEF